MNSNLSDSKQMMNYLAKSEVSYNSGDVELKAFNESNSDSASAKFQALGVDGSNFNTLNWDWYRDYWNPTIIREYYPSYVTKYVTEEDTFKKAFRLAKKLLKKKLLNSRKLPDFIQLVEMIAAEL